MRAIERNDSLGEGIFLRNDFRREYGDFIKTNYENYVKHNFYLQHRFTVMFSQNYLVEIPTPAE